MRHLSKQRCWRCATDAVGRRWIRGPSWTHRVFGCEFQPTPSGKSRGGIKFACGCGAVQTQNSEDSGACSRGTSLPSTVY